MNISVVTPPGHLCCIIKLPDYYMWLSDYHCVVTIATAQYVTVFLTSGVRINTRIQCNMCCYRNMTDINCDVCACVYMYAVLCGA